jgi:hypothetical protein
VRRWQFVTPASQWLATTPLMIRSMALVGVVGEWFIAIGLYVRLLRPYAVLLGVVMNLMVLFTVLIPMELSLIMMASYILFIEPETWQRLLRHGRPA